MKIIIVAIAVVIASVLFLASCATVGLEKAQYEVLEKQGRIQIRQYPSHIVAETTVESDFEDAGNQAFNRLFDYISGENRGKVSIKMTAPVSQWDGPESIDMTAPVTQQRRGNAFVVSFLMPAKYTMQTLPEPLDSRVRLREVPPQMMAAIRYSGTWSKKKYEAQKARLRQFIEQKGLQITGEDIFSRYDPPFQPGFLRRNEVQFPVAYPQSSTASILPAFIVKVI